MMIMAQENELWLIIAIVILLGWAWAIPIDIIYKSVVALLTAAITAGLIIRRRKRRSY